MAQQKPPKGDHRPVFRRRPLAGLGMLLLAGSGLGGVVACGSGADDDAASSSATVAAPATAPVAESHMNHGGPAGEGEGAGTGAVSLASNTVAYLSQLNLIRGHLNVGVDLYRNDHVEEALTHMKHPGDELYAALLPAFEARGVAGFAEQLQALMDAVKARQPANRVQAAFDDLQEGIDDAAAGIPKAERSDPRVWFAVVVQLMTTAADEYAIAVVDGRLESAHEYQDALGFTRVARRIVDDLAAGDRADDPAVQRVVATAREQLDGIQVLWVGLIPPETLEREASTLYGAAARVELAASALR